MRIIGVDPGYNMSGLAVRRAGQFVFWLETSDPCVLFEVIVQNDAASGGRLLVLLEDYLGEGQRNKYNKRTIEVIGYVKYSCLGAGIPVEMVPQQQRLANVNNVPSYIKGKDVRAAAAHVLSYCEKRKKEHVSHSPRGRILRSASPPAAATGT